VGTTPVLSGYLAARRARPQVRIGLASMGGADYTATFDHLRGWRAALSGQARLTALITARSDAVTMFGSSPTPHRI
jgi:hypothetical protein